MSTPHQATPGWYADPQDARMLRWWDGSRWGVQTTPARMTPGAVVSAAPGSQAAVRYAAPQTTAPGYEIPVGAWRTPIDNRPIVNGMGEAIKVVFAKYAQFDGRASRSEYWYFALFLTICYLGAFVGILVPIVNFLIVMALMAGALAVFVPSLAVTVRRMRDAGWTWPWIFLSLVPGGSIFLIVVCCQPSKYP